MLIGNTLKVPNNMATPKWLMKQTLSLNLVDFRALSN